MEKVALEGFFSGLVQEHVSAGLHTKEWPSLPWRQGAQHHKLFTATFCAGIPDSCHEEGFQHSWQGSSHNPKGTEDQGRPLLGETGTNSIPSHPLKFIFPLKLARNSILNWTDSSCTKQTVARWSKTSGQICVWVFNVFMNGRIFLPTQSL